MLRLLAVLMLISTCAFADEDEWTHFTCPPANSIGAYGSVKFQYDLPSGWSPVLPPAESEKWMATRLVASQLSLLDGTLHLKCSYATGGEMIADVERLIPQAETKFTECIKDHAKHCAMKGKGRRKSKYQSAEYACLVDVKLHDHEPETSDFLPFGVMNCENPLSNESGCHFKCRD